MTCALKRAETAIIEGSPRTDEDLATYRDILRDRIRSEDIRNIREIQDVTSQETTKRSCKQNLKVGKHFQISETLMR